VDGPSYLYGALSLPADAAKEIRGPITRWPAGSLTVYEDGSFVYVGPTDYALYQLYVDGIASAVDIGYGPGIGYVGFTVGSNPAITGNVQLGDVSVSGALAGGQVSGDLSGGVGLQDVAIAGNFGTQGVQGPYVAAAVRVVNIAAGGSYVAPGSEISLLYQDRPTAKIDDNAQLDYGIDWTDWLAANAATIGTLTIRCDDPSAVVSSSIQGAVASVLIAPPTGAVQLVITSRLVTAGTPQLADERSIWLQVLQR
jgi:hypothetical protein